jgi:uridine kinase
MSHPCPSAPAASSAAASFPSSNCRCARASSAATSVAASHPLRVAVDGSPAVGKTTLADELAVVLRTRGREVIRASTESFHLPRAQRYRRGEFSPEANYNDSFDYDALRRVLLDPLGRTVMGATSTRSTTSTRTSLCPRRS